MSSPILPYLCSRCQTSGISLNGCKAKGCLMTGWLLSNCLTHESPDEVAIIAVLTPKSTKQVP